MTVSGPAPVNGAVRANLHIVLDAHAAQLRDKERSVRIHIEPEARLADPGTRVDEHAVTENGMAYGRVCANRTRGSDHHTVTDHSIGMHSRSSPDPGTRTDDRTGRDRDTVCQDGARIDGCGGMDTGNDIGIRVKALSDSGEVPPRSWCDEQRHSIRSLVCEVRGNETEAGIRGSELETYFRFSKKLTALAVASLRLPTS